MGPNSDAGDCIIVRDSDEEGKDQVPKKARATKDMKKKSASASLSQPGQKRRGRPPKVSQLAPPIVLSDSDDEVAPRVGTVSHNRYHPYPRAKKATVTDTEKTPDELQATQPATQMPSTKGRLVAQNSASSPHLKNDDPDGTLHAEREKHLAAINELKKTIASKDEALARKDEALASKNNELTSTRADLVEKIKDYNYEKEQGKLAHVRLRALSDQCSVMKKELTQLGDNKATLELQNKHLETKLSQAEKERDLYCRELGSLDSEKTDLEEKQAHELQQHKDAFQESHIRQLQLEGAKAAAQKKVDFLSAQLGASRLQVQSLEKDLVKVRESAAEHIVKVTQLGESLRKSQDRCIDLSHSFEKATNTATQVMRHNLAAQKETEKLKETLQNREGELEKFKSEVQHLKNELKKTLDDVSKHRSQIDEHERSLIRSEADGAKFEAKVADAEKVKAGLEAQLREANKVKADLGKRADDLQHELVGVRQKLDSLKECEELSKQQLDDAKKESAQLREEVGMLNQKLAAALGQCEKADEVLSTAKNDTKALEKRVKEANDSIMELKQQLEVSKQARKIDRAQAEKSLHEEKVRQNGTKEKLDVVTEVFSEVNLANKALSTELDNAREEVSLLQVHGGKAAVKEEIKNPKHQDEVDMLRQTIASLNQNLDGLLKRFREKEKELAEITKQLAESISHQAKSQIYVEERDALGSDKIKLTTQLRACEDEKARLSKSLAESNETLSKVQTQLFEAQDLERYPRVGQEGLEATSHPWTWPYGNSTFWTAVTYYFWTAVTYHFWTAVTYHFWTAVTYHCWTAVSYPYVSIGTRPAASCFYTGIQTVSHIVLTGRAELAISSSVHRAGPHQVSPYGSPQDANVSNGDMQPGSLLSFSRSMPPPPPVLPVTVVRSGIPVGVAPADPTWQPAALNMGMRSGQTGSNAHNMGGANQDGGVQAEFRQPRTEAQTPASEAIINQSIVARAVSQNGQTLTGVASNQAGSSQTANVDGATEAQERPKKRTRITDGSGTQVKRPRMTPSANVPTTADMQGQKNLRRSASSGTTSSGTIIVASSTEKTAAVTKSPTSSRKA
ncbi:hypothetical protein B0H67DRAFT_641359 [Lasiosphaeris hirsuta]|uniref:Uncharacterized protein n=1 Tax=Lasiosphaeris hirsuta TaxID=260670 RepID=A0AA40E5P4_9PEZI|nr:hypothetical protein B0H67DRAFT_641359 [Lasiosphaeris hirsuta]